MGDGDTTTAAVQRAKSYSIVSSIVGNSLTFAICPRFLDSEESPDNDSQKKKTPDSKEGGCDEENGEPRNSDGRTAEQKEGHDTSTNTLLPTSVVRKEDELSKKRGKQWAKLPLAVQKTLNFLGMFLNGPLIGSIIGGTMGLVPPLQRAFF